MRKYNTNTFNIGHGYNSHYIPLQKEDLDQLNDNFNIKVGYVGNLTLRYIDWKTIHCIVSSNPSVGFYFIGPASASNISKNEGADEYFLRTKENKNSIFIGSKPGEKIPGYLAEFDMLLLIYKADKHVKQLANPHKMLEYLGSGNTILASWTHEYRNLKELLVMVDNNQIQDRFSEIIDNLDKYNSAGLRLKRKLFAKSRSYPIKIIEIEPTITLNNIYLPA